VTSSTALSCPACYHKGSYYSINETWQDVSKCINYTCLEVSNPCYPSNTSVQIEASEPVCQACPAGYKTVANNNKCCPDCVPTSSIPDVCGVERFGRQVVTHTDSTHGQCVSTTKHQITGCSGFCATTSMATIGNNIFESQCKCCQPAVVQKHNITMKCEDGTAFQTLFNEILSCQCKTTSCPSSYNANSIEIRSDSGKPEKRSLFENLDISQMDEKTINRHRRNILNDLAMVHTKNKRR